MGYWKNLFWEFFFLPWGFLVKICVDLILFSKMEITIRPHGLRSVCCVATTSSTPWDKIVSLLSQNLKNFWTFKEVLNILEIEIDLSCQGTACWTFENGWRPKILNVFKQIEYTCPATACLHSKLFEHSKKQKLVKAFNKAIKKLSSINVHFVMPGQTNLSHLCSKLYTICS